jgi:hypothetical protein
MELFQQFGVTQTMLQGFVIIVVAAVLVGLYWRILAIGAGMLFVVFVFAYNPSIAKMQINSPAVESVSPDSVPAEDKQVKQWHKDFMEDCLTVTDNTKEQCESIWSERIEDEKHPEKMAVNWKKYKQFKTRYL